MPAGFTHRVDLSYIKTYLVKEFVGSISCSWCKSRLKNYRRHIIGRVTHFA